MKTEGRFKIEHKVLYVQSGRRIVETLGRYAESGTARELNEGVIKTAGTVFITRYGVVGGFHPACNAATIHCGVPAVKCC